MNVYVAFAVGCIECGVPAGVIGVYATRDEAEEAVAGFNAEGDSWAHHGGQGYTDVWGPIALGARAESWAKLLGDERELAS